MQINLTGFLNGKYARMFMGELWTMLDSAQNSENGIPAELVNMKMDEIKERKGEDARMAERLRKLADSMGAEAERERQRERGNRRERSSDREPRWGNKLNLKLRLIVSSSGADRDQGLGRSGIKEERGVERGRRETGAETGVVTGRRGAGTGMEEETRKGEEVGLKRGNPRRRKKEMILRRTLTGIPMEKRVT